MAARKTSKIARENLFHRTLESERKQFLKIAWNIHRGALYFMETEEIAAEMVIALYNACMSYDWKWEKDGVTLMKYWYKLWENRVSKLLKAYYTQRERFLRAAQSLDTVVNLPSGEEVPLADVVGQEDPFYPPCPVPGRLQARVWDAIARTDRVKLPLTDIRADLGISQKTLRDILREFREAIVHDPDWRGM